jgi:hypothetical protein
VSPSPIDKFTYDERWHYSASDQNYFAIALSQVGKYYEFLLLIKERFDPSGKEFVQINEDLQKAIPPGISQVPIQQAELLDRSFYLQKAIVLDIESFYVFAKILLDKLARFIEQYFGPAQGCSLRSHDRFVKSFAKYVERMGLSTSDELLQQALLLKEGVADFRDKQIEHKWAPRTIGGISLSNGSTIRTMEIEYNPRENASVAKSSESLDLLLSSIDRYLDEVFELIRRNREKSKYQLEAKDGREA